MVVHTEIDSFSEYRVYPGKGQKYVSKDGRIHIYATKKSKSLALRKVKPQRITWTVSWRKANRKIKTDEAARKRKKKAVKIQRSIVGRSLDDIKKMRDQKPETRKAQAEQAAREIKERKEKQIQQRKAAQKNVTTKDKVAKKAEQKAVKKATNKKAGKK